MNIVETSLQTATRLTRASCEGKDHAAFVNPSVVRASTTLFPDVASLRNAYGPRSHGNEARQALSHLCHWPCQATAV